MSASTHPITYRYVVRVNDGLYTPVHVIDITRRHVGTAYARNGNVSNPTEYFVWDATVETLGLPHRGGVESATRGCSTRSDAYEHARATALGIPYDNNDALKRWVNVRPFTRVADEMKANYVGREVAA
jgi:hypothetical protein